MKDREGINSREAGIALTAHPDFKIAVNIVCSVRRKKNWYSHEIGEGGTN